VSRAEPVEPTQSETCAVFVDGLTAFRARRWEEAQTLFQQCLDVTGNDGPSRFYLTLCEQYLKTPPTEEPWDAVISLEKK